MGPLGLVLSFSKIIAVISHRSSALLLTFGDPFSTLRPSWSFENAHRLCHSSAQHIVLVPIFTLSKSWSPPPSALQGPPSSGSPLPLWPCLPSPHLTLLQPRQLRFRLGCVERAVSLGLLLLTLPGMSFLCVTVGLTPSPPQCSLPWPPYLVPQPALFFFFFFLNLFIYLFMAVLGLRFCVRAFSSRGKRGPLFIAMHGPLTIAASPVAEHRLQTRRLSNCGLAAPRHVGSSQARARTRVPCIGRQTLNHCATREAPALFLGLLFPCSYSASPIAPIMF